MTKLQISIINYRTKELTEKTVKSITGKIWNTDYKITLVDNASNDDSIEYLKKKLPKIKLIESDKNLGFAGGHNLVLKDSDADYYLILNSDVEVKEGFLDNLVEFMDRSDFGIGSCKLLNKDGSFQPNGGDLPYFFPVLFWLSGMDDFLPGLKNKLPSLHRQYQSYYHGDKEMGWVGGTAMIIKKETLKKIGSLDDNIFMYAEDIEYCLRGARFGIKTGWTDKAELVHLGGASSLDPHFRQWVGEFKGLLYIYKKYFGITPTLVIKLLIYKFTILRMLAFLVLGKMEVVKTYAKVLKSI